MAPLLLLFILLLPHSTNSDSIGQYCDKDFQSPQIQTSITTVLSDLQTKAPISGFATSSSGQDQNIVYGLAQCRGDVSSADCTSCIDEATYKLKTICPKKADVRIWYDYCFMRYNTNNFIGKADTGYAVIYINLENATDPERFDVEVGSLMRKVREKAVVAGSGGLGRGKSEFTPYVTIYGLAQCTRDLEPLPCAQCLSSAVEKFPEYCRYRKGCQVLYSSCIVRYEVYPFFFPLDDSTSSSQYGNRNITSDVGQYLVVTVVQG